MKRLLLAFTFLIAATAMWAQGAVGTWRQYRAYGNATDQLVADGRVFCLASGNLFAYDPETEELETFDTQTGLGGNGISFMEHDAATHTLVIVYTDGLIDLMDTRTLETVSLIALRDANVANKVVNSVFVDEGMAWLCTDFGLVTVNLAGRHFGETYDVRNKVQTAAVCDNILYYCVKGGGMYRASLEDNLHDIDAHVRVNGYTFTRLLALGQYLYGRGWKAFYRMDTKNNLASKNLDGEMMVEMRRSGDRIIASYPGKVIEVGVDGESRTMSMAGQDVMNVAYGSGTYWASCGLGGLQPWRLDDEGALQQAGTAVIPNSPRYDYFYRMHYVGGRLLVAGGAHEYTNPLPYAGMASYYEEGTWVNLDTVLIKDEKYENITNMTQHPDDPTVHYLTSMGHGMYVYRDGHFVQQYDCDNSPLMTMLPTSGHYYNYVRTAAPTFDANGNLWVLNCNVDTIVWRFSGTKWKGFYYPELAAARSPIAMFFDAQERMWVLSRDMEMRGVFCYDPTSNSHRLCARILQQDGVEYVPENFLSMAQDKNGQIWVGTDRGLFVIDRPEDFVDPTFEWTQIKVNRDDGSGLADYLFSGAYVSAIAVDGGNRKWIGTLGSGVYLISPDGQETIHHFTSSNSPLPCDDVRCIAINPNTGEVMIGTVDGLASYMSDATEPEETLAEGNIEIYPNPVRPDYEGDVIVRGLAADCEVKIASIGGQVLWSGTSVGGTITWNLQRKGGGRVSSGIYNVIINTPDASNVIVGRLAVIR